MTSRKRRSISATPKTSTSKSRNGAISQPSATACGSEWKAEFGIRERPRRQGDGGKTGSGDQGGTGDQGGGQAPALPARKQPADHSANANRTLAEKPKRPADSPVKKEFTPAAAPESDRPKAGWKQRKSAAERKLDGSYKPRQRKGPTPGM